MPEMTPRATRAFWKRVRRRLDVLGLGQNEFARRVHTSSGQASQWLRHHRMPKADKLLLFPKALKCSGHWLLTGEGNEEVLNGHRPTAYEAGRREALADIIKAVATERRRS